VEIVRQSTLKKINKLCRRSGRKSKQIFLISFSPYRNKSSLALRKDAETNDSTDLLVLVPHTFEKEEKYFFFLVRNVSCDKSKDSPH
jgi:hypothetical protein